VRLRVTFKAPALLVAGYRALVKAPGVAAVLRTDNSFHSRCLLGG
jgi:hypothetical protein